MPGVKTWGSNMNPKHSLLPCARQVLGAASLQPASPDGSISASPSAPPPSLLAQVSAALVSPTCHQAHRCKHHSMVTLTFYERVPVVQLGKLSQGSPEKLSVLISRSVSDPSSPSCLPLEVSTPDAELCPMNPPPTSVTPGQGFLSLNYTEWWPWQPDPAQDPATSHVHPEAGLHSYTESPTQLTVGNERVEGGN